MDSPCSNHIVPVTQQWRKLASPILSTSHCEFNGVRSCAHAQKTIPLVLIHPFSKQIVPLLYQKSSTSTLLRFISPFPLMRLINHFLPLKTFLRTCHLLVSFFIFIAHLFCGLAGAYVNPGSIFSNSLFMHSLCSLITHSFLNGFQPNLYQGFSHVCSTCHTIFSLK